MTNHVEPTDDAAYQQVADRVLQAARELNQALEEAYRLPEIMVILRAKGQGLPQHYDVEIFRLTHKSSHMAVHEDAQVFKYTTIPDPAIGVSS